MTHEEFTEDMQKLCVEEINLIKDALHNRQTLDVEATRRLADALRKWSMLWIDLEKRKKNESDFTL